MINPLPSIKSTNSSIDFLPLAIYNSSFHFLLIYSPRVSAMRGNRSTNASANDLSYKRCWINILIKLISFIIKMVKLPLDIVE